MVPRLAFVAIALAAAAGSAPGLAAGGDRYAYRWEVTPEEGPVDRSIERRYSRAFAICQEQAQTTRDNSSCYVLEFARQDAALNRTWRATLRRWPVSLRPGLIAAQRAWVARRDPFCRTESDAYAGGTIAPLVYVSCRTEVTIRRTMWLERLR